MTRTLKEVIEDELHKPSQNWFDEGMLDAYIGTDCNFTKGQKKILNNVFDAVIKGIENWILTNYAEGIEEWLKEEVVPSLFTREGRVVLIPNHDEMENNETIEG